MDLGTARTLIVRRRGLALALVVVILGAVAALLALSVANTLNFAVGAGSPTPEPTTEPAPRASAEATTIATPDPTAEPTPVPTPVPTPGPIADWELAATFGDSEQRTGVHDVATWHSTFVAVGESWTLDGQDVMPVPHLWQSADGLSWSHSIPELGPRASVQTLAPMPDGSLMLLGTLGGDVTDWSAPSKPAAWTSTDGVTWTAVDMPFSVDRAGLAQFAAGAEGIIATTEDRIWYSPDARAWEMVYDAPRGSSVGWPIAGDEGWIVKRYNASLGTTTLLVSGEAVTWHEVDLGNVGTIATVAGDWLATRHGDDWERAEILRSQNGLDWRPILDLEALPVEESELGTYDGATMTGTDELFVLSPWRSGHCYSMPSGEDVFWSRDGASWVSAGLVEGSVVTHAVESGETSVLVGYLASTGEVAFWVSKF